ncbi:hypothetical protein BCA37_24535 [Mycobacterium sp. djl-10]|nr:hypothetical protein BCA37_24535 [Mycobacterium sp. djl-10]
MEDTDILRIRPTEITEISAQLDRLAGRVETLMETETPNLVVEPGARDEVSLRVAQTLNSVHDAYTTSAHSGITEMREVAATLRSQSADVTHLDEGFTV